MYREFLRYLDIELGRGKLTIEAYSADLLEFNEFLKNTGIDFGDAGFFDARQVSPDDIRAWISELSEKKMAKTSIRRKIQSLRSYFKFLLKRGIVKANPALAVPLPKKSKKLPEIATQEEVEEAIDSQLLNVEALALEMLFYCGLRRSELLSITDSDINIFSKELKVLGKGNKERIIPLTDSLMARIRDWQQERDELYPELPAPRHLMATKSGKMSASTLYKIVNRALSKTTASKKSPHTLRHSFATSLLNKGADINSVKELLGHSSLAATEIYTHVAFADLAREWKKAHPRSK